MPIKRPYQYKCPYCGNTKLKQNFGCSREQITVKQDELPTYYVEYYGCPKCGQYWDVEYEMKYEIKNIKLGIRRKV